MYIIFMLPVFPIAATDPVCLKLRPSVLLSTTKFDVLISLAVFHSSSVVLFCNEPLNVMRLSGNVMFALAK